MSQENQMKIAAITEKNIEYLNSENIKMKPENQMETPLITEKEIEHLNSYEKLDQFIGLCGIFHLARCKVDADCFNCRFIVNIRYLYLENLIDPCGGIVKIQNIRRLNFSNFFSIRIFLKYLAAIERERIELGNKFQRVLKIWNVRSVEI